MKNNGNKIKEFLKKEWPALAILLASLVITLILYPRLPDRIPMHWNIAGEVDRYGSRLEGAFMLPLLSIALYAFYHLLPIIDPKRKNYSKFNSSYTFLRYLLLLFFLGMQIIVLTTSLGLALDVGRWVTGGVGLLFILLGNIMSRFRFNYFVGVRTPWTLASEEVWRKTHLLASKLMVIGGLICLLGVFPSSNELRFTLVMLGALVPSGISVLYSYLVYRKLEVDND